jgi:succinyldiaminopimelate transaminase
VDPTPDFIQSALIAASNAPGYPLTIGSPELREAIRSWAINVLGVQGDFDVLPSIGSKEVVANLASQMESSSVLYPEIAYPTYLVGALLAGAQHEAVGPDPTIWPSAELVWVNSPSNPTGRIAPESELRAVIDYSRKTGAIVASDECYLHFPGSFTKNIENTENAEIEASESSQPQSILRVAAGDNRNLLTLHSLSKRSNLAGYRGGVIIGDPALIAKIREVRKHAGLIVPAPVQAAMIAALGDEKHVRIQAERYINRRAAMTAALQNLGFVIDHSEAGLYIWCSRGEADLDSVQFLAELGILVTPGRFYGDRGKKHVRVALTATDPQIASAVNRMMS